jgi:hypothetical protein
LNSISDELDSGLGIFMKLFIILYMFPPLFYYFIHSFNSFFRKMIFTNFKTSSPRKINSQIIEIFNYLNISPIIIKVSQLINILYWSKLITGKDIKLSIISYRLLYLSQSNNCQFSWLNYVDKPLFTYEILVQPYI